MGAPAMTILAYVCLVLMNCFTL